MQTYAKYFKFATIKFFSNFENKLNIVIEIFDTLLFFVVYRCIFKTLYNGLDAVCGISFEMAITSLLIAIGLDCSYHKSKMFIQEKLKQGTLLVELIKPMDYQFRVFFEDLGNTVFNIIFHFFPAVLFSLSFAELQKPNGIVSFFLFCISLFFGFVINWIIDFIFNEMAFYITSVYGVRMFKSGIIDIFGGVLLPVWFLPEAVRTVLFYTPIVSIFFIPLNFYFGLYRGWNILFAFGQQLIWIYLLFVLSRKIWNRGIGRIARKGV